MPRDECADCEQPIEPNGTAGDGRCQRCQAAVLNPQAASEQGTPEASGASEES